jgi:hypothetical protein
MQRRQLFWGSLLVLLGFAFLLQSLGFGLIWNYFWPLLVIALGGWMIYRNFSGKGNLEEEKLDIALEDIKKAEITIKHGAGRIDLKGDSLDFNLMSGSFYGGVEKTVSRTGEKIDLRLEPEVDWAAFGSFKNSKGLEWRLVFSTKVEYIFNLKTGAGENFFDFSELNVKKVVLNTGASSTRIQMPGNAGFTSLEIHAGAASVDVKVPENVAARIKIQSGLSGNNVDTNRFKLLSNGIYESPDYESAENKIDMLIEGGVGSFNVN